MNKSTTITIVALSALLLGGLGFVLMNNSKSNETNTTNRPEIMSSQSDSMGMEGTSQSASGSTEAVETNTVNIKDFEFTPSKITVKKGTTVTWTNQDTIRHDIRPENDSDAFKGSELLAKGESYSWTFDTVGTYTYICSPHPYMKGTVEVVE
jgi:plastocyanin